LEKYSDGALLLGVVAIVAAQCTAACRSALGFTGTLLFNISSCGVKDRNRRRLACNEAKDGKRHNEEHFSHFSSPLGKNDYQS
jgi:hypothetical protein